MDGNGCHWQLACGPGDNGATNKPSHRAGFCYFMDVLQWAKERQGRKINGQGLEMKQGWKNRIVGHGTESPDQLLANPQNWRTHPAEQKAALGGILSEVGLVQSVIVNQRTGYILDGHARVELALKANQEQIPVVYVDLSEDEERLVLAVLDPIGAMAGKDDELLRQLLDQVSTDDDGLQALLDSLAGLGAEVDEIGLPDLADGDREPFQQMTFTLHDSQVETVNEAIERAKAMGDFDGSPNENGNGNALARICEIFLMKAGR